MTPPHERAWTWLTSSLGRVVFGVANLREMALKRLGSERRRVRRVVRMWR